MSDIIHRCEECGAVLPAGTSSQRRYCDACRKFRKKETDRAWHQKRSAREAKKPPVVRYCTACRYGKSSVDTGTLPGIVKPKEKPKTNHDLIVDDNAAAAAKGMSYGKFKEWQRRQKELKERGEI